MPRWPCWMGQNARAGASLRPFRRSATETGPETPVGQSADTSANRGDRSHGQVARSDNWSRGEEGLGTGRAAVDALSAGGPEGRIRVLVDPVALSRRGDSYPCLMIEATMRAGSRKVDEDCR